MFYVFSFVQRNEGKQLQALAHLLPSELDTILLRSPCSQNLRFVTVRVLAKIVRVQRHCACGKHLTSDSWYCVCPGRVCVVPTGALLQLGSTHGPGPGLVVAHLATPGTSTAQHLATAWCKLGPYFRGVQQFITWWGETGVSIIIATVHCSVKSYIRWWGWVSEQLAI